MKLLSGTSSHVASRTTHSGAQPTRPHLATRAACTVPPPHPIANEFEHVVLSRRNVYRVIGVWCTQWCYSLSPITACTACTAFGLGLSVVWFILESRILEHLHKVSKRKCDWISRPPDVLRGPCVGGCACAHGVTAECGQNSTRRACNRSRGR